MPALNRDLSFLRIFAALFSDKSRSFAQAKIVGVFVALTLLSAGAPAFAKYNVCSVTINSSDERETFKRSLNPNDFNFIELTDFSDRTKAYDNWFQNACQAGVQCDVLIVSGHFGGNFFGDTNFTLNLKDLEEKSCNNRCAGILNHPKEVYLFGCNTLASKDKDTRTPEQYLDVLVHEGVARLEAERIVAARYGPFGSSFRDRMERIFENVPAIYGFSSVGPLGEHVSRSLGRYLRSLGDFKAHLDAVQPGYKNPQWLSVMRDYNRAEAFGLSREDRGYTIKTNSCLLSDRDKKLSERLTLATDLISRDPMLYLPTVSSFINESYVGPATPQTASDAVENSAIQQASNRLRSRSDLYDIFQRTNALNGVAPSIKIDLVKSERLIGWVDDAQFAAHMTSIFRPYTTNPSTSDADVICSQVSEDPSLAEYMESNDALNYPFTTVAQYRTASCMHLKDPRVAQKAVRAYSAQAKRFGALDRMTILWSIDSMFGAEAEKTALFRPLLNYRGLYQNDVRRWALVTLVKLTHGDEQIAYLQQGLESRVGAFKLSEALKHNSVRNDRAVEIFLANMFATNGLSNNDLVIIYNVIDDSKDLQDWLAAHFAEIPPGLYPLIGMSLAHAGKIASPALKAKIREAKIKIPENL